MRDNDVSLKISSAGFAGGGSRFRSVSGGRWDVGCRMFLPRNARKYTEMGHVAGLCTQIYPSPPEATTWHGRISRM